MAEPRPITHRRVLNIALPIVLSNATVPILGAVDTGVVGQLGAAAPIGAVGIGEIEDRLALALEMIQQGSDHGNNGSRPGSTKQGSSGIEEIIEDIDHQQNFGHGVSP